MQFSGTLLERLGWETFLCQWRTEELDLLRSIVKINKHFNPTYGQEKILSLGDKHIVSSPISTLDEEVRLAEAKFGVILPPSYKSFITLYNGWFSSFYCFFPIEKIEWYKKSNPETVNVLMNSVNHSSAAIGEDGFNYDHQPTWNIPAHHADKCIKIGLGNGNPCFGIDNSYQFNPLDILINTNIVLSDSEMEIWHYEYKEMSIRENTFSMLMERLYVNSINSLKYIREISSTYNA